MSKVIKQMLINDIEGRLGSASEMLVVDCSLLDAVTANRLRLGLAKSEISAITVKNSLAKRALGNLGVKGLDPFLEGPSTIIWGGEDIVALSKEIAKWAGDVGDLKIKGATVEGTSVDAAGVTALSKSPGREELIGQIAGLALSPGSQIAGALLGPGGVVAGQIDSIASEEDS